MSDVIKSIERNNLKLSADKILQGLKKVRNEPSKSRRRWIWELVQNAKDVPNAFGRVRIKVVLTDDELRFSHNGDPFTIGNITGLIQQVSTKASGGDDEEVTGKFGTGFISTHLLSERTTVHGVTVRPNGKFKRFTLELDRSGRTAEELIPHIEAAIDRIKGIDKDPEFEEIPDYAGERCDGDLDTTLVYRFTGKHGQSAAQAGLDDLRNTLPFTLANVPKIEAVDVVDVKRRINVSFECKAKQFDVHVRGAQVAIREGDKEEKVHFFCWDADGITLMVEVADPERKSLKPNFGAYPTLYRQFPLIGSEKFHWPFMVNGDTFFPTEDREGLFLNSEEDEDSLTNRQLLERAVDEAVSFTNWLIDHGFTNRYVMAYTRIPDIAWDGEAKEWYKGLQAQWRRRLLEMALIENVGGEPALLKDVFIPKFGSTKEVREAFWDLYAPYVGYGLVPRKDLLHSWIEAVGPDDEIDTWGKDLQICFGLDDLFCQIANDTTLDKIELDSLPKGDKQGTLDWLLSVLQFAIEEDGSELLSEHAVVPNHLGALYKLGDLYEEDGTQPIPDAVLDILKSLGVDWRAELIHRAIKLEDLQHRRRGLRDASEKVAELLNPKKKAGQGAGSPFLEQENALDILFNILSMVPPGSRESFQSKLFKSAAMLFGHEGDLRKVEGIGDFNFAPALRLMIEAVHTKLTELGSVEALATELEVVQDKANLWLDAHLRLVEANSEYEHFLKTGNIVPNRKGELMAFEDVYAYGTVAAPLDPELVAVLLALDEEQDWDKVLVGDGIGIRLPSTRTMEELGSAIQKVVATTKGQGDGPQQFREPLLRLIEWCEHHDREADRYLGGFLPQKDALFFELVAKGNIGTSVIRMLGSESGVNILRRIAEGGMDAEQVDELLRLSAELGSLSDIIATATDLVEEKKDFEYKKALGLNIERALVSALETSCIQAEVVHKGAGSHDIEIISRSTGRSYHIELKSVSEGNTGPLKLAASQARAFIKDPNARALCVLERRIAADKTTAEHIKEQLLFRKDLGSLLLKGLEQHDQLEAIISAEDIDMHLLGEVRIKLKRERFMAGAGSFDTLIDDIRTVLAQ